MVGLFTFLSSQARNETQWGGSRATLGVTKGIHTTEHALCFVFHFIFFPYTDCGDACLQGNTFMM